MKRGTKACLGLLMGMATLRPSVAEAANVYKLKCKDPACTFRGRIMIGDVMMGHVLSGYCGQDQKFVSIFWPYEQKAPEPVRVWDAQTNVTLELYKCPDDGALFLPITSISQIKYCPLCHHEGVEAAPMAVAD